MAIDFSSPYPELEQLRLRVRVHPGLVQAGEEIIATD